MRQIWQLLPLVASDAADIRGVVLVQLLPEVHFVAIDILIQLQLKLLLMGKIGLLAEPVHLLDLLGSLNQVLSDEAGLDTLMLHFIEW